MRFTYPLAVMFGMLAAVANLNIAHAESPTSRPVTMPAAFSVRGKVFISTGLNLSKADLSHVVVYLDSDALLDAVPIPSEHQIIAQKDKQFVPKFLAVPRGTVIEFPNWDHISHNVFSRSAAAPAFDLDRYPYGQSKSRTFTKVGTVQMFCNVHPQMRAMVYVTPNIFLSRCDKLGQFNIDNIPAGKFTLVAWHDRCGAQKQSIVLGNGTPATISMTLAEDHNDILANDPAVRGNKYGTERGLGIKHEQLNLPVFQDSHPVPEPCPDCKQ